MAFFKKSRSGPKVGGDCKKGGGMAGPGNTLLDTKVKIKGAGASNEKQVPITKKSGSAL